MVCALLGSALLFTACGKEDDPDIRDLAAGNYQGNVTMYALNFDNEMEEREDIFGAAPQLEASAYVEKGSGNKTMIINVGDKYNCTNISAASNGFTFDIETQTTENDETIIGFDVATLDGNQYNGIFLENNKELQFGVKIDVVDLDVSETVFNKLLDEEISYVVLVYELEKL